MTNVGLFLIPKNKILCAMRWALRTNFGRPVNLINRTYNTSQGLTI